MKVKISLLLVFVLCVSVFLPACGKKEDKKDDALTFAETYNTSYEGEDYSYKVYEAATLCSELTNMFMYSENGNLCLFKKDYASVGETKAAVLNTETGEIVFELKEETDDPNVDTDVYLKTLSTGSFLADEEIFIEVTKEDKTDSTNIVYTYILYSSIGKQIASKTSKVKIPIAIKAIYPTYDDEGYIYSFDDKICEIKDGEVTFIKDSELVGISTQMLHDIQVGTKNNYYSFSAGQLFVFNIKYDLVAYYAIPAGCSSEGFGVLSNGNVVIQYMRELPFDASEYDIFEDGTKYNLTTIIFNISDSSTKEIEFNWFIEDVYNFATESDMEDVFAEGSIDNVIFMYPIVDKAVDTNNEVFANCNSEMEVLNYLGGEIQNQAGIVYPIAKNRFVAYNKGRQSFLLNENKEVIGEITGLYFDDEFNLFVKGSKYYDLDLKFVFDSAEIKCTEIYSGVDYSLYRETKKEGPRYVATYYVLRGATMKKLDLPETASNFKYYERYFQYNYSVTDSAGVKSYTTYCNINGDVIFTVETTASSGYTHTISICGDVFILELKKSSSGGSYNLKYYIGK